MPHVYMSTYVTLMTWPFSQCTFDPVQNSGIILKSLAAYPSLRLLESVVLPLAWIMCCSCDIHRYIGSKEIILSHDH